MSSDLWGADGTSKCNEKEAISSPTGGSHEGYDEEKMEVGNGSPGASQTSTTEENCEHMDVDDEGAQTGLTGEASPDNPSCVTPGGNDTGPGLTCESSHGSRDPDIATGQVILTDIPKLPPLNELQSGQIALPNGPDANEYLFAATSGGNKTGPSSESSHASPASLDPNVVTGQIVTGDIPLLPPVNELESGQTTITTGHASQTTSVSQQTSVDTTTVNPQGVPESQGGEHGQQSRMNDGKGSVSSGGVESLEGTQESPASQRRDQEKGSGMDESQGSNGSREGDGLGDTQGAPASQRRDQEKGSGMDESQGSNGSREGEGLGDAQGAPASQGSQQREESLGDYWEQDWNSDSSSEGEGWGKPWRRKDRSAPGCLSYLACEAPRSRRRVHLPRPQRWSSQDTLLYRRGYPGKRDHPNLKANCEFYFNEIPSYPDGDFIDRIHLYWWGNYDHLEFHHGYIQWLFPIRETGMNFYSQELQLHEIERICANPTAHQRILKSYEMMLDFYGMRLVSRTTGRIKRADNWKPRFRHLNRSMHNYLRITRILKCLGEFHFEHLKGPFVRFMLREAIVENTLRRTLESCLNYWLEVVKDDRERKEIREWAERLASGEEDGKEEEGEEEEEEEEKEEVKKKEEQGQEQEPRMNEEEVEEKAQQQAATEKGESKEENVTIGEGKGEQRGAATASKRGHKQGVEKKSTGRSWNPFKKSASKGLK